MLRKIVFFSVQIAFLLYSFSFLFGQCLEGDCINGTGKYLYPDSSIFSGKFENKIKEAGELTYKNGDVYSGYFKNNKRDSIGRYIYRNGDYFEGVYLNDQKLFGIYKYINGNSYHGSFFNNKPHGYGQFSLADGTRKEGFWSNGVPDWSISTDSINLRENVEFTMDESYLSKNSPKNEVPRIYALIVGISDYYGFEADLQFAHADAFHFYNHLQSAFPNELANGQIKLLTDHEASHKNILNSINSLFSKSSDNDYIIFYFSGHGGKGTLIPSDLNKAIYYSDIKKAFKNAKAKYRLCIIDACYAGSIDQVNATSDYNNHQFLKESRLAVLLSSTSNQTSSESANLKQGLFSYWLIKGMRGAADLNNDKYITAGELFVYTKKAVIEKSRRTQIPVVIGQNLDKIPLCKIK